jgi:hypothetical protein
VASVGAADTDGVSDASVMRRSRIHTGRLPGVLWHLGAYGGAGPGNIVAIGRVAERKVPGYIHLTLMALFRAPGPLSAESRISRTIPGR